MKLTGSVALLGHAAGFVSALNAPLPRATGNIANDMDLGFSPVPTTAPVVPRDILEPRAASGSLLGYYAPDNTCGYVGGVLASSKTCAVSEICAAVVVGGVASMGCCNTALSECQFLGNCIGSVGYYSSSLCGAACQADINTLKCTAATKPYCYSYLVPGITMRFYSCASTLSSAFAPFATTYAGEADGRVWKALYDTTGTGAAGTAPTFSLSTAALDTKAGFAETAIPTYLTSSTPTTTADSSGSNGSHGSITIGKKKKSSAGGIAGGIVGGLAILGLIAFGVVFALMKKKKNVAGNRDIAAPNGTPGAPATAAFATPPPQPAMVQQAPYDPNQQHYPPPQGQYPQQPQYAPPGQDPRYSYFAPSVAGTENKGFPQQQPPPMPNQDYINKQQFSEQINSIPGTPVSMFHRSQSPAPHQMMGPPPATSPSPLCNTVYEAPAPMGVAMQQSPMQQYQASPQLGAVAPAMHQQGMPQQQMQQQQMQQQQMQQQQMQQQPMQQAPVELDGTHAYPTHNPQGAPVFEAS